MDEESRCELDKDADKQAWKNPDRCLKGRELLNFLETGSKSAMRPCNLAQGYSQQTCEELHGVDHCKRERNGSTDTRESSIPPERIGDERWSSTANLVMDPCDEQR